MNRRPFPFALLTGAALCAAVLLMHAVPTSLDPVFRFFQPPQERVTQGAQEADARIANLTAEVKRLEEENVFLRRDGAVGGDAAYPKLLARVLYADPDPARHAVRIALPGGHTVTPGDPVVAAGDVLVGVVEHAGARSADVLLIDDPGFRIAARIDDVDGVLIGKGGGVLAMEFVPATDLPSVGATIITAASDNGMPEGIAAASVHDVVSDPGDPFISISALPLYPLRNLSAVAVLIGNQGA